MNTKQTLLLILTIYLFSSFYIYSQDFRVIEIWVPVDSINSALPGGVLLFEGINSSLPLKAWYLSVDETSGKLYSDVVVAGDTVDRKETILEFSSRLNPLAVINGGYFNMKKIPCVHAGLLVDENFKWGKSTNEKIRKDKKYNLLRAVFGIDNFKNTAIYWASDYTGKIRFYKNPFNNFNGRPDDNFDYSSGEIWDAKDFLEAGPMLIKDGKINITSDEEVFFNSSIPKVHPRSAVGKTADGKIIYLVVDGRQAESRGVDLIELATILFNLGCIDAMNLDGGGSSTLVVNGKLINRPAGKTRLREVMSAIAIFAK